MRRRVDIGYHRSRAAEELSLAAETCDPTTSRIHIELAQLHRLCLEEAQVGEGTHPKRRR